MQRSINPHSVMLAQESHSSCLEVRVVVFDRLYTVCAITEEIILKRMDCAKTTAQQALSVLVVSSMKTHNTQQTTMHAQTQPFHFGYICYWSTFINSMTFNPKNTIKYHPAYIQSIPLIEIIKVNKKLRLALEYNLIFRPDLQDRLSALLF